MSALEGIPEVLAYIDETLAAVAANTVEGGEEVAATLLKISAGLRNLPAPTWAEVTISEVLAERDAFRAERDEAREQGAMWKRSRRFWVQKSWQLRRERNHARSVAVLLEQALAAVEAGHE